MQRASVTLAFFSMNKIPVVDALQVFVKMRNQLRTFRVLLLLVSFIISFWYSKTIPLVWH
jgi:hypothetical protein